ncbi:MAG: type 1 glutamine amidotransferase [Bdellovibrio sp.]
MKHLLIIQHEHDVTAGTTLEWAKLKNYQIEYWYPAENSQTPNFNFDMVVICGGSMDTFEEDKYPWLKTEKAYIAELIQRNIKIFGLCLGAQLLAEMLGGSIYKHVGWEIGFVPVQIEQKSFLNVFHWHQYSFQLPPGAQLLAQGDYCYNQAFTYGNHIVGTQFHPESTVDWILECADCVKEIHFGLVQTPSQIRDQVFLQKKLQDWYFKQLDNLAKT